MLISSLKVNGSIALSPATLRCVRLRMLNSQVTRGQIGVLSLPKAQVEWYESAGYQFMRRQLDTGNNTGNDHQRSLIPPQARMSVLHTEADQYSGVTLQSNLPR
jgi:hypothetical protein